MRRNGEGQSRNEDPSTRVDAFSRAILDEKDPAIRGYMENLRSQIAVIAARHGANARDVWNKEVQDRMSVDEMDAVNDLFRRIKGLSEKNIPSLDAIRMERELSEREDAASELLGEALAISGWTPSQSLEAFRMMLGAGMLDDATAFLTRETNMDVWEERNAELLLAEARTELAAGLPDEARMHITAALIFRTEKMKRGDTNWSPASDYLEAYDVYLALLSVDELMGLEHSVSDLPDIARAVAAARLAMELEVRNPAQQERIAEFKSIATEAAEVAFEDPDRASYYLLLAKAAHALGLAARPYLDEATRIARTFDFSESTGVFVFHDIVVCASAVGDQAFVHALASETWWWDPNVRLQENIPVAQAEGRIGAHDFEAAAVYLRAGKGGADRVDRSVARVLVNALLVADRIQDAERAGLEFLSRGDMQAIFESELYVAARARRGDDILFHARQIADLPGNQDNRQAVLANAAIATIGYTMAMKKRIAEYAKR